MCFFSDSDIAICVILRADKRHIVMACVAKLDINVYHFYTLAMSH